MYRGFRIVPEDSEVDFIGKHKAAFLLSLIIVISSVGLVMTKGLNFGIDFTGGMLVEIRYDNPPSLPDLRTALNDLEMGSVSIQEFGSPNDILIRFPQQGEGENQKQAETAIKDVLESFAAVPDGAQDAAIEAAQNEDVNEGAEQVAGIDYRRFEFVGPQVGKELIQAGILAIIFSIGGILAYVSFRFEWHFGVASIVALTHDAIATVGLFALTQMEFNLATVAAVLMIAGYSINDTVVVFDRVRENLRKFKKQALEKTLNLSLNQTLARTLLTSVTTMIALIALWVFGGEVIRGFVDALIFGIVIGTYSSIFVASPILLYLGLKPRDVAEVKIDPEEKLI
jgi:preprotein translocase SecF subunit